MRFALISDLHLGHAGTGRWHNHLLYDHAEEIVRAAVSALNREAVDAVYILGDITEAGEERQLTLARAILAELTVPWFVLPGNHDRAALHSGLFDAVFGAHAMPEFTAREGIAIAAMREHSVEGDAVDRYRLDESRLVAILEQLEATRPEALFVFSHQPLADETAWVAAHAGKDAGYFQNGPAFLERAAQLAGNVIACSGHQHWHHVIAGTGWRHCGTAALIEYPMEARIITWDTERLASRLLAVAPARAAQSLEQNVWVRGRDEDRDW